MARRPAFIGVVQADSGHRNPEGDLFTRPGHESLTLAFCLATRSCMNLGPSFLGPICRQSPGIGQKPPQNGNHFAIATAPLLGIGRRVTIEER